MEIESIRSIIMSLIKNNFSKFEIWERIESRIVILCSELVEPTSDKNKKFFLEKMKEIKDFLLSKSIDEKDLTFIDDEIKRYNLTKTLSLYVEEEDSLPKEIIEKYSRLGFGTEGVVGIHQDYNYSQLSKLTNGVFKKTGLIKFYISKEKKIYGKIMAEAYEHSQKIPIATLVESKRKNKDTGEPAYKKIFLFGEKYSPKEVIIIKEISIPFFVYRFLSEKNKEMILFTPYECPVGDYIVEGVSTQCTDYRMLTETAKLPTKLPFFFAQNIKNRIIKYKSHKELKEAITRRRIPQNDVFNFPFTIKKKGVSYKLLYPRWYKKLIWAWLLHESKGLFNNYPLHLMILGPKQTGKSLLLNSLHSRSKETRDVFSGVSSTLKSLIPSFRNNPARLGYLAESNRFSFCDEFLRCIIRTSNNSNTMDRDESVGLMNDLLEHQKRRAGSGIASVNVNMTSRIIATTNPVRGIKNVTDLINRLDESFLSRWIIYNQDNEHIRMIRDSLDSELERYDFDMQTNDWISFIDYLNSFSAKYDMGKIKEIYSQFPKVLNETLKRHYDARHKHHLECLIDGIVKTRCFLTNDMKFEATEEDYKSLMEVWSKIIGSWINLEDIKKSDVKDRIFYLPETAQYLYWEIYHQKDKLPQEELKKSVRRELNSKDFDSAWTILNEMDLLIEKDGKVYTAFEVKLKEEDSNVIFSK